MSIEFPYTINGLNNIDADDVSCDTFLNQPSSYFTGISSNLQTQLNTISSSGITQTFADSRYAIVGSNNAFSGTNTFNSNLPTTTLTSGFTDSTFITQLYADSRYGELANTNEWTSQNTFRNGILPCRGTGANPETDIQIGGNNQFQYRQANSQYNIGIGALTIVGDSVVGGRVNNIGKRNIGIGHQALNTGDNINDCIAIGYQAMQNCGSIRVYTVACQRQIAIGTGAMQNGIYSTDSIAIGTNALKNCTSGNGNIVIAHNGGVGQLNGNAVIIGTQSAPTISDNSFVCVGYRTAFNATGQANRCVFIGEQAGLNNNNGYSNTYIGGLAGQNNTTGSQLTCLGTFAGGNGSIVNAMNSVAIGNNAQYLESYEFVIGGDSTLADSITFPRLTLPNKNRINCCQFTGTPTTFTINWRTNEYVVVNSATCTQINLPQAIFTNQNRVGACFHICRTFLSTSSLTITAFGTEKINYNGGLFSSIVIDSWVPSISLVCVDNVASVGQWSVYSYNDRVTLSNNSNKIQTLSDSTNANYYMCFTQLSTGVDFNGVLCNSNFRYNPHLSLLTVPNITSTGTITAGELNISNKIQIQSCQFPTGSIINLSYNTNENVILQDATTVVINLPTPSTINIGAKFNIIRAVTSTNDITIKVTIGESIGLAQYDGSLSASASFLLRKCESQVSVVCIANSGMTWMVLNTSVSQATDNLFVSSTIPNPTSNYALTFGGLSTSQYYPQFSDTTNLNYKPDTQTLTAKNVVVTGTLSATATTATTATNATITDQTASATTFYPTFVSGTSGNLGINAGSNLQYRPDTQSLLLPSGIFQGYKSRATCYQYLTQETLITGTTTLINPLRSYYPFTMKNGTAYTVTLPEITALTVGTQITFKRIGGPLQTLTVAPSNNQPAFLLGNNQGLVGSFGLVTFAQSCGTIVSVQTQDTGSGSFSNTANSTIVNITVQNSGTLAIGGIINLNGNVRYISAYSGTAPIGTGGTGNYIINQAIVAANTNQPYTSSITYGWAVTSAQ